MTKGLTRSGRNWRWLCGLALLGATIGIDSCLIDPKDYPVESSSRSDADGGESGSAGSAGDNLAGASSAGEGGTDTGAASSGFGGTLFPGGGVGGTVGTNGPPPSCAGLAATCGPSGNGDCCASNVVTGVTTASFHRSYDGATSGYTSQAYPARVSDFRLDTYEITVGRFRKFWNTYPGNMPAAGSGKNPNNASDPGWDATWNTSSLPASQAALTTKIECQTTDQTWTAGNDALPMNCIDWFEAEAFCIWDGGRLPTEAEWNYAAAGGTQQRVYPWGSAALDCTYANFQGAAGGTDFCVAPGNGGVNRVGSESPKGDGLYGQADLAGNVWEWVQDWYANAYTSPCSNCAYTTVLDGQLASGAVSDERVLRGGSFNNMASYLLSSYRYFGIPSYHSEAFGARCARTR